MSLSIDARSVRLAAFVCALFFVPSVSSQTLQQTPRQEQTEVLRVFTELVQTDVMVFDKQGRFVDGLNREDFELRIDGKSRPIDFFEKITAGSVNEESQLAAARGSSRGRSTSMGVVPLDRGRPIYFFVDDLHLNPQSLKSTKDMIIDFVEKEMGQNDEAAIASTSGQIGFLQQLTDNRAVLRAAVNRLTFQPYSLRDMETPSMSEYQALLIEKNDKGVTDLFVIPLMKDNPGLTYDMALSMVRTRARVLLLQAVRVTTNTLGGLERLVKSANNVPGRKLVFFISDGFLLDTRNSNSLERLRRITSAAAKSGVVIYAMDSRGLVTGMEDATSAQSFDLTGAGFRSQSGELTASQDALNVLAKETGGKAFFNNNRLAPFLTSSIKETSNYYLLAWKPERESLQPGKFRRLEVRIVGKPDLRVQVRRGYFDLEPESPDAKTAKTEKPTPAKPGESELRKVISAAYPIRDIPISLRLNYVNTPNKGETLSAALQVPTEFLSFSPVKGKPTATLSISGTVFNDKGQAGGSFNKRLTVSAKSVEPAMGESIVYGYSVFLKPGIYQMRVAARDEQSGRAGSAHQWIEIPDLSSGNLALSSLLVGSRVAGDISNASTTQDPAAAPEMKVSSQFATNEFLRFLVLVYNASPSPSDAKPDVAVQVQVIRDDQPVITAPQKKVALDGVEDLRRIPYGAEMSLTGLPTGHYLLRVSIVDRVSKRSASQQTRFEIH